MIPAHENVLTDIILTDFRTDYLLAMTKIQKKAEKETERIRKKYNLTERQMDNLVKTL